MNINEVANETVHIVLLRGQAKQRHQLYTPAINLQQRGHENPHIYHVWAACCNRINKVATGGVLFKYHQIDTDY